MYVEYSSNNSGGSWWLKDDDWIALEKAGWKVAWAWLKHEYNKNDYVRDEDGTPKLTPITTKTHMFSTKGKDGVWRYMGALAREAYRVGLSLREAAEEWERVTRQSSTDPGCPCCGQPHRFTEYDDNGMYVKSGPDTDYTCTW